MRQFPPSKQSILGRMRSHRCSWVKPESTMSEIRNGSKPSPGRRPSKREMTLPFPEAVHFLSVHFLSVHFLSVLFLSVLFLSVLFLGGCRRESDQDRQALISVYGFSVVKEPLEKEIFPAYRELWARKTGQELTFAASFAGSEMVTNQIISGVGADVAILAIERNADRLVETRTTLHRWRDLPHGGIVHQTPMVILVQKGNPFRIRDFSDLARPRLRLIHCDPISSGAGQWSLLAVYGAELRKIERREGRADPSRALATLEGVWKNVVSTPGSAREARTQFERKEGDALITYEMEALELIARSSEYEMVMPATTIYSEHPVVMIHHPDHPMSPGKYAVVELFVRSLWERPAQEAWVRAHFRSVTDESLNRSFRRVPYPFRVADLGGWKTAYPEIVEGVWKRHVMKWK
jgi:ABC-type sulfate transport system substrate-binding protein